MNVNHIRFENYQPQQSFYMMNKMLKLLIVLQLLLFFFRLFVRNQEPFFFSDFFNEYMMMLTYCQKSYCLALITMFYIFSLIYWNAIFFLQFVEYNLPFFIGVNKNFTLKLIFSTLFYIFESIMLYHIYKEYKGIIYDINQHSENAYSQEQNIEIISSQFLQQSQLVLNHLQQQIEQQNDNQQRQESNIAAESIGRRINNQTQRIEQVNQELQQ